MASIEIHRQPSSRSVEAPLWKKIARRGLGIKAVRRSYEYALLMRRLQQETDPTLSDLNKTHGLRVLKTMEGYINHDQATWLKDTLRSLPRVQRVAQTGFNGGHSAAVILDARPDIELVSFDLGEHDYVHQANEFITTTFPERHTLILGDSQTTLPHYTPETPFDLVFIDGGHTEEIAAADIRNFAKLAPGGIVILDDYLPNEHFGIGPFRAWNEAVRNGAITPLGEESTDRRAWVYGVFNTET